MFSPELYSTTIWSNMVFWLQRMGNIDEAVPFFGSEFNRIYPLIMVIYTLLVASNFFDRVINFFGSLKRFRFQTEVDDMDGFDPSGLIILQKGIWYPFWSSFNSYKFPFYLALNIVKKFGFVLYFHRKILAWTRQQSWWACCTIGKEFQQHGRRV